MPDVLFEEISPLGNVQALVEADDRTCYFYLNGAPDSELGIRSVWVRNLRAAPARLDVEGMADGVPPMNPAAYCRSAEAGAPLHGDALRICWLPEGNGAALFEGERMIAVIPPWSGTEGFHGYSEASAGQGSLAWEMPQDPALTRRIDAAREFWLAWGSDPWPAIRDGLITVIEGVLGRHSNYYAIDGGA